LLVKHEEEVQNGNEAMPTIWGVLASIAFAVAMLYQMLQHQRFWQSAQVARHSHSEDEKLIPSH